MLFVLFLEPRGLPPSVADSYSLLKPDLPSLIYHLLSITTV